MRIIYLLLFIVCACKNGSSRDIKHFSLEDNESMIYENYTMQHNGVAKDEKNEVLVERNAGLAGNSYFLNQKNDINCLYNCEQSILKIGVVAMSLTGQGTLEEIENTIAFLNSNIDGRQYSVFSLKKEDLTDLSILSPDIIVGPFKDSDVQELEKTLQKQNLNTPIVSLTTTVNSSKPNIYYFGYSNNDIVQSTIQTGDKMGFENYGVLMPNNAIGSATYNLFKKHIDNAGKKISRVEFYDDSSIDTISKFISKIEIAVKQKYYISQDGTIIDDNYSFTKNIKTENEKSITLNNGQRYEKKYKKMDALIIDSDDKNFEVIFDALTQNKAFEDVVIVGSPRIIDSVIFAAKKEKYLQIEKPLMFSGNYEFYSNFYTSYLEQFGIRPTRLSTTLYETLVYLIALHKKHDITQEFNPAKLPEFAGLNGDIFVNHKSAIRSGKMCEFKNGKVKEGE